jgi:POT family proton-dependent oligopeptide transporter
MGKRGREPADFTKIIIGYLGVGAAYLLIAAAATMPVVPMILWISFFLVMDFSFGWAEPPTQSLISRDSPASVNAMMMATMKASGMPAYFFVGWLGRFYEPLGPVAFWGLTASLPLVAALAMLLGRPLLQRMLEPEHPPEAKPA